MTPREPEAPPSAGGDGTTSRAYMPKAKTQEWETPHRLFEELWQEFGGFDYDPCCRPWHNTAQRILMDNGTICLPPSGSLRILAGEIGGGTIAEDGLRQFWHGRVYMNPPYGRVLADWVRKAAWEVAQGRAKLVVALLPARTDTRWWHTWIGARCERAEVRFLKGRLRFVGAPSSATFPSVIVVWRGQP